MSDYPSRALISRSALAHNLAVIGQATRAQRMAVVKADGYGHGITRIAKWAAAEGIEWFGVAQLAEAFALREQMPTGRILAWIYTPGAPLAQAIEARIDLSVGSTWSVAEVAQAARKLGRPARVHVEVDTGMSRGGFGLQELEENVANIAALASEGVFDLIGLWSHLARADEPESDLTEIQVERFERARELFARHGLHPMCHLGASAGTLWHPNTHYDMVRVGIAMYGLSPNPARATARDLGLHAVMQLEGQIHTVREVGPGTGVSYGHTFHTAGPARLGVVGIGYGDGVPRALSNRAAVSVAGMQAPIRGRVCMDQFIVEGEQLEVGQWAQLFGDARDGLTTADELAEAAGTIGYEIVTALGPRVARVSID